MKIFLNYKRSVEPDQPLAEHLERAFRERGYDVFRDATGIPTGSQWASVIQQHLEESEAVVALVSNASLRSSWVLNEIDWARRRGKLLVPVLLEKLEEALEFQEFMPRFMRVQHYVYKGEPTLAAADLCERLRHSPAAYEALWSTTAADGLDGEDDSENPQWRKFFEQRPQLLVNGRYRLTLIDAVRLAVLRSAYYQRRLREGKPLAASDDPAEQRERLAFQAFRQGFFTLVAAGDFGVNGFRRLPPARGAGELGGYIGVLVRLEKARCLRDVLAALEQEQQSLDARWEAGMIEVSEVQAHRHRIAVKEAEMHQAAEEAEDALDHFKTYRLGLPAEVGVDLDDPMSRSVRLADPALLAVRRQVDEFHGRVGKSLEKLSDQQLADLAPDVARVRRAVEALFPEALRKVDQLTPEVAGREWTTFAGDEPRTFGPLMRRRIEDTLRQFSELNDGRPDEPPFDDADARRRREDQVVGPLRSALDTLDQLAAIQSQVQLAAWEVAPVKVPLDQALKLAMTHRPDRALLESNVALRRELRLRLRRTLAELDRLHRRLGQTRRATQLALDLFHIALVRSFYGGRFSGQAIPTRILFLESQCQLTETWAKFLAARMRLSRDTGLMEIDPEGAWLKQPPPKTESATPPAPAV